MASRLRRSRGVSYDAVMGLAAHLTDDLEEAVPFSPRPDTLDARWRPDEARRFLAALRDFATEARFDAFFSEHRPLYETTVSRMRAVLTEHGRLDWFDPDLSTESDEIWTVIAAFGVRPAQGVIIALDYQARLEPDGDQHLIGLHTELHL